MGGPGYGSNQRDFSTVWYQRTCRDLFRSGLCVGDVPAVPSDQVVRAVDHGVRDVDRVFRRFAGNSARARQLPRQFSNRLGGNEHGHPCEEAMMGYQLPVICTPEELLGE